MTLYRWSQTASADATADSTINWAEGQSPSSVNDSARAMMAATAKYRDDTGGNLSTAGTSTAYTITSNQVFASKALMNGQEISFLVHATNGASPTLNVDGLGASVIVIDAIPTAPPAGTLIAGGVYTATYYIVPDQWRLKNFYQLPFTVPIGGVIDYFGASAPSSNFVFPYGQAISRTTYAALFALMGTTYGTGDGSTTFNIPDLRGRVIAGKDDMGGSAASRLSGTTITTGGATTLGGSGGAETKTLVTANLPPYTPAGTITNGALTFPSTKISSNANGASGGMTTGDFSGSASLTAILLPSQAASTFTGTAQGGTSTAVGLTQPTIIANKILRII